MRVRNGEKLVCTETRMKRNKKSEISRDIGLEIGSICGRYFFDMQHLHYGYWTEDLAVNISNLHAAQANYAKFVSSHIPDGVKTILDIGCGTGQMAKDLQDMGYTVDCISPNAFFAEKARKLLGEQSRVFECAFQDFENHGTYDLVMFCESFQYIGAPDAIGKSFGLMKDGGHLLICDYFARPLEGKSMLAGGEKWTRFSDVIVTYPLQQLADIDITDAMAPTLDIVDDVFREAVQPTVNLAIKLVASRYPWPYRLVQRIYRRRIEKIKGKYFSGRMTGENFKKYKSYRLLLYRKNIDGESTVRADLPEQSGACV